MKPWYGKLTYPALDQVRIKSSKDFSMHCKLQLVSCNPKNNTIIFSLRSLDSGGLSNQFTIHRYDLYECLISCHILKSQVTCKLWDHVTQWILRWKMENRVGSWHHLIPRFKCMPIPLNALKVNIDSCVTILTHRLELGTTHPSGPPCSVSIGTEIVIHDLTIQGNLGRLESELFHSPLNPWTSKFCSCPSVANLPGLT